MGVVGVVVVVLGAEIEYTVLLEFAVDIVGGGGTGW